MGRAAAWERGEWARATGLGARSKSARRLRPKRTGANARRCGQGSTNCRPISAPTGIWAPPRPKRTLARPWPSFGAAMSLGFRVLVEFVSAADRRGGCWLATRQMARDFAGLSLSSYSFWGRPRDFGTYIASPSNPRAASPKDFCTAAALGLQLQARLKGVRTWRKQWTRSISSRSHRSSACIPFGIDASFTNASLFMLIVVLISVGADDCRHLGALARAEPAAIRRRDDV